MGKSSGGVRTLANGSQEYNRRQREVSAMLASGKYSSVEFSRSGGGYVAIEKSAAKHKSEEIEAAKILANKGYKVILKDESKPLHKVKTPDGYLFSASFEQRTPTGSAASTVKNALLHARDKRADIAVIYTKNSTFTRQSIDEGITKYERVSNYRLKKIIVVSPSGRIHLHKHND